MFQFRNYCENKKLLRFLCPLIPGTDISFYLSKEGSFFFLSGKKISFATYAGNFSKTVTFHIHLFSSFMVMKDEKESLKLFCSRSFFFLNTDCFKDLLIFRALFQYIFSDVYLVFLNKNVNT